MSEVNVIVNQTVVDVSINNDQSVINVDLVTNPIDVELGYRGLPGRDGGAGAAIDDLAPSTVSVYSSQKVEDLFDEEVSDSPISLEIFFENQLSQGN